jgi:DNA-directed RNA polymerase subunit RPC12/RpoP
MSNKPEKIATMTIIGFKGGRTIFECSNCHRHPTTMQVSFKICPYCGAKVVRKDKENDH